MALDVLMPVAPLGLSMAFSLGFAFGMGPCLLACFPYLGPVFLNSDGGVRHAWRLWLPLTLGRLSAYGVLGLACGLFGTWANTWVETPHVRLTLGVATLMVAGALLWRVWAEKPRCGSQVSPGVLVRRDRPTAPPLMSGGLYLMGVSMALTPCAPLGMVLVAAAALGSAAGGAVLGLVFGLGATLVPALVYGVGAAWFGRRLRQHLGLWRRPVEVLSATLLLVTGSAHLWGMR